MVKLENFQKKAVAWILGPCHERYINQPWTLNVLPLPMYIHLKDILTLPKLRNDKSEHILFPKKTSFRDEANSCLIYEKPELKKQKAE